MDQNFAQPDFSDKSRTELQRRLDQGEQPRTILEELYRGIQSQLYRRAYASLQDVGLAEDLVQTVFMKMHASFDSMIAREPVLPWILTVADHELADRKGRVEEQGSIVEPVLIYLRTIVAKGWLREMDLHAYWQGLAGQSGKLKSELNRQVRAAFYVCEILGAVRAPHREAEIRSHLDLAASLTTADRVLLRLVGGAVRLDPPYAPVLLPEDAEAAIKSGASRVITLHELHEAESRYAAAIPHPSPRCIESPCAAHTASRTGRKANDDE